MLLTPSWTCVVLPFAFGAIQVLGTRSHCHHLQGKSNPCHLPGLVRAPKALLVVERGFALVLVAEVWAAAAAAASVARFCNCKAFMPVEGQETQLQL